MTRARPFTFAQISPPEARPSRLRALRAQRREKRLARNALIFIAAANSKRDRSAPRITPAKSASPPPSLSNRIGERPGVGGTTTYQEDQQ
jgi:hypothetical protein